MKTKERKALAKKIAALELKLQEATTKEAKKRYEDEIMKVSGHVDNIEDMVVIDDMVREILKNQ